MSKGKEKNPVGRPPKYKTAEELQKKAEKYFKNEVPIKKMIVNGKKVVNIPMPTITGLVLYLGFCDRYSFYEYEKKVDFTYTIRRIRSLIAQHYEEQVLSNPQGAIFALKNFGWSDKIEIEKTEKKFVHIEFKDMTPDQLKAEAKRTNERISGLLGICGEN